MSFNPLMTLLVRSVAERLGVGPTVIELGNQTFNPNDSALDAVIQRSTGVDEIDVEGLKALQSLSREERREKTAAYFECLGFTGYEAIDINDRYGSRVMDLNKDLGESYGFRETYDLVTNNGTGEHIFDQARVLSNMHNLVKPDGIMLHVMPMLNYVNHGFYSFHPSLYYSLTRANDYAMLALGLAHRRGTGVVADPENGEESLPPFLLSEERVPLGVLLGDARFGGGGRPALKRWIRRILGSSKPGNTLGDVVHWLETRYKNVLIVAALRKRGDQPFRIPIQTLYAGDFSESTMQSEYDVDSPSVEGAR